MAVLGPLPEDPLERLMASGDLQQSDGDLTDLAQALSLPAGSELPSAVLGRLRRDER